NLNEIISRQETIFNNLKQISINYKKDGPSRKTLEYLEERLSRLNTNWEKFVFNHQQLEKSGATDIQYFVDDVFNNTKKMYEDVLQDILKRKAELPSTTKNKVELPLKTKTTFSFDDINFHIPPCETDKTNEKQQELLRQQYCNFRAFERTVEKINFDSSLEKWELEDSLNILKGKWELIEKTNWELDYISRDEDSTYKQKYDSVEKVYDNCRKKLQLHIWNNAHYEKTTPKIVIPDFHGNYHQWHTFKDLYLESVHNNPLLSKAQKMQHLKTKLKGEAEKIVQHLGISAENYNSCWEIITHRYDNKRLLFTSYMNTLLNQPHSPEASAASIRKLHDVTLECLNGLGNIGLDLTNWDPIIVHLLVQKLDKVTYNEYINDLKEPREVPDLKEFTNFLENKFMALEALQGSTHQRSNLTKNQTSEKQHSNGSFARNNNYYNQRSLNFNKSYKSPKAFFTTTKNCPICKTEHVLMKCCKFLAMNVKDRNDAVRNLRICSNCLYSHGEQKCNSKKYCKLCNKSHHTLLHDDGYEQNNRPSARNSSTPSTSHAVNNLLNDAKEILLTTVLLKVKTINGDYISLRGLLDQGSQVSLVTEHAAQRLRLPRRKVSAIVSGVGSLSGNCKGSINLECKSIHSDYEFKLETLVMKKLVNNLPTTSFSIQNWDYIDNLKLADPHFNESGPIDLLLGAEIYSELILNGVIKRDNFPVAQQTRVGWILCGNVKTFNCFVILTDLENMTRFWETEEISDTTTPTNEDEHCENYYNSTTERLSDGTYVKQDTFTYQWRLSEKKTLTKRVLLSEISKLYDPLGFLSPATIKAKLLFQKVWISKINWDDCLPIEITAEWEKLRRDFPSINKIAISRWLQCTDNIIDIHGFCDASEKAYACVIYSLVKNNKGYFTTTIITAKTKVAPLKKKISLPRMAGKSSLLTSQILDCRWK
ncbi:hypothetical protein HW555_008338, partial [Spodoptera exigua]